MSLAAIDGNGTKISYHDSGPPNGVTNYTTLVITHGLIVNGASFERLQPHAHTYGLRIIRINNRDYADSTRYTDAELADLASKDTEVQAAAIRRWGTETASFLRFVCEKLGIPPASDGAGGVVLVAEGLGNVAALAILGDERTMGPELTAALAPFLRTVVLYEPPMLTFGVHLDDGPKLPIADPTLPISQAANNFLAWIAAHYAPISTIADITPAGLRERDANLTDNTTLRQLSQEEVRRMTDLDILERSGPLIMATPLEIRQRHARRALMDADAVLPGVDVLTLWCDSSVWVTLWGAKVVNGFMNEQAEPGKRKREMRLVNIPDANHLVHLEQPERVVRLLAELTAKNN